MELNVAAELKLAGRPSSRHFEENMQPIDFGGHKLVFTMPVSVDLTYVFFFFLYSAAGVLSPRLMLGCTRCNEEFGQDPRVYFS